MKTVLGIIVALILIIGAIYLFNSNADDTAELTDAVTSDEIEVTTRTSDVTDDGMETVDTETERALEADTETEADTSAAVDAAANSETFDLTGTNYEFDVAEIRVTEGTEVTINFEAGEGFHDWVVDEFDAATEQVRPEDGVTSVTFVADTSGTYEYYCSVGNHRAQGMVGMFVVEPAS